MHAAMASGTMAQRLRRPFPGRFTMIRPRVCGGPFGGPESATEYQSRNYIPIEARQALEFLAPSSLSAASGLQWARVVAEAGGAKLRRPRVRCQRELLL